MKKKHLFENENEIWTDKGREISLEVENFLDIIINRNRDIYRRDLGYIFHDAVLSSISKAIVFEASKRRKEKKREKDV
jgi:hypothetical protein